MSVMNHEKPDLLYAYLPHLDYALQKFDPNSDKSRKAFFELDAMLRQILNCAEKEKYRVILFGDYPITPAKNVIFPNKTLYKAGLFKTRNIKGMHYPDYHTSEAFCIADHRIAHLHLFDLKRHKEVKALMENLIGVDKVLDRQAQADAGINHPTFSPANYFFYLALEMSYDCFLFLFDGYKDEYKEKLTRRIEKLNAKGFYVRSFISGINVIF